MKFWLSPKNHWLIFFNQWLFFSNQWFIFTNHRFKPLVFSTGFFTWTRPISGQFWLSPKNHWLIFFNRWFIFSNHWFIFLNHRFKPLVILTGFFTWTHPFLSYLRSTPLCLDLFTVQYCKSTYSTMCILVYINEKHVLLVRTFKHVVLFFINCLSR